MWPPDDKLLKAWCLFSADRLSAGDLADLVLPPLLNDPAGRVGDALDLWEVAATEAVFDLIRHPARYDSSKGTLPAYLRMAARADLANLRAAERRHHRHRLPWEAVAPIARSAEPPAETNFAPLAEAARCLPAADQKVFDLMRDGEFRTPPFAEALGLTGRTADEQRRGVKRAKDRVLARLRRAVGATR